MSAPSDHRGDARPPDARRAFDVTVMTGPTPGAIAVIQLHGAGAVHALRGLTGREDWPDGRMRLVSFGGIDQGLAVAWRGDWAQLMPHGGPRVVRRLVEQLRALGGSITDEPDTRAAYPEASSALEADLLDTLARAVSPAAIDLLLAQPEIWRGLMDGGRFEAQAPAIVRDAASLDRLITPPTVVLVGRANVGKSTLSNRMLRRQTSVVADLPGTTRDWVAGLAELLPHADADPLREAVAVRWIDTPGLRHSDDAIEQHAIELAGGVVQHADVLIAVRDPASDWPELPGPRGADVFVVTKADTVAGADAHAPAEAGGEGSTPLPVSAHADINIGALEALVLDHLGLRDRGRSAWAFSVSLKSIAKRGDREALARYLGV